MSGAAVYPPGLVDQLAKERIAELRRQNSRPRRLRPARPSGRERRQSLRSHCGRLLIRAGLRLMIPRTQRGSDDGVRLNATYRLAGVDRSRPGQYGR